ncbi:hypothetical protein [Alicyclobacillus fructus]|uniref:hypothetical protein n=1 Tax=Alicyclobacillus fructus TaxID=2816082 RepID=UPI001F37EDB5|nr:hypothetical protein [Alicyclobacillus fructus]
MLATARDITCVLAARDEARRIANVLRQVARAGVMRVSLCVNGATDGTLAAARRTASELELELTATEFAKALGHDAPRAIAAMEAWRRWPHAHGLLLVDADWQGSFGPMLSDFIQDALCHPASITGVCGRVQAPDLDRLWERIVRRAGAPAALRPFLLPQLIPLSTFTRVSPRFAASPGLFFALTRRSAIAWRAYEAWDGRLVGNPARSAQEQAQVLEILREDARAAERALFGGAGDPPPLWPGLRNWREVEAWMSQIRVDTPLLATARGDQDLV